MSSPEMKIMIVDDDTNILDGFRRVLSRHFPVTLCSAPLDALSKISPDSPFSVVISDMHMPGMDGINFLAKVKERSPDTVRMMLTGDSDIKVAVDAVNEGQIFRFLTKPCDYKVLGNAILTGIQQYRLVTAEKELLEKTLRGSILMLTEILSSSDPKLFGMATRIRDLVRTLAPKLNLPAPLDLEFAALFSPIGWVPLPLELREKVRNGAPLSQEERAVVARVPQVGQALLSHIPRLERVANLIRFMHCPSSELDSPAYAQKAKDVVDGAKLLKILSDFAQMEADGLPIEAAFNTMRSRHGHYDPKLLSDVSAIMGRPGCDTDEAKGLMEMESSVEDLCIGDTLAFNVETVNGRLLAAGGILVTPLIKERLLNFQELFGIKKPIIVRRRA